MTTRTAKSRDAVGTRALLLAAARRRFAWDGYSATTVRDIANDAGVNVALINRYFTSKEGLFTACLQRVVADLDQVATADVTVDSIVETILAQVADLPRGEHPLQLLLLLRSSGDDRADQIRRDTLQTFTEGMAAAAGWRPGDPDDDELLVRAQVALAAALGIVVLRSSTGLEPLTSATAGQLRGPLGDVLTTLLAPKGS
ncbi:MAG: TetR family transcriptional regulator [Specibacter sp.]